MLTDAAVWQKNMAHVNEKPPCFAGATSTFVRSRGSIGVARRTPATSPSLSTTVIRMPFGRPSVGVIGSVQRRVECGAAVASGGVVAVCAGEAAGGGTSGDGLGE